jgi:hypothetical protein
MRLKVDSGGGLQALVYTLKKALEVGPVRLWKRMRSKNACKTCALGMGGMQGGMVNEAGHFPEVCKKSLQAQVADMQGAIAADFSTKQPGQTPQADPQRSRGLRAHFLSGHA